MLHENELDILLFRSRYLKQREYWTEKLAGEIEPIDILEDYQEADPGNKGMESVEIPFPAELSRQVLKLGKNSDLSLYILLVSTLKCLIFRLTGKEEIIVLSPINKLNTSQETMNHLLFIRDRLSGELTFKEAIIKIRQSILEAYDNQDYPYNKLLEYLSPLSSSSSPGQEDTPLLSNILCSLGNIHHEKDIQKISVPLSFKFLREGEKVMGRILYDGGIYKKSALTRLANHFLHLLTKAIGEPGTKLTSLSLLTVQEEKQLLVDFNNNKTDFCRDKTVVGLFEEQAQKIPDAIAITCKDQQITYKELNRRANRLARVLKKRGLEKEQPVGVLMERSLLMAESILAAWKAGGAYIPMDYEYPLERIRYILQESGISILLTDQKAARRHSFTRLHGFHLREDNVHVTGIRPQVKDFDGLPHPDRTLVNYEKYNRYIGHAAIKNSMSLQATRGCPYNCAYCHRIWPKSHVRRSPENLFNEVKSLYDIGVRKFSFVDDIFNLNIKNSSKFFKMIIDSGMKVQFSFPNGLRGDLLTNDYIDLMIEAGTINFALALETASPRLQKLIGKNLDLDKLSENIHYICEKHPHVILELFTMHGFPTETEEEAMMTLNFIKRHQWFHFPYVVILKIYPNTDMEKLALENGVSKQAILRSENMAFHELPETSPFDKAFTLKYQADFFNDYFLSKERLINVLPRQMKLLTEDEIIQKYNSYLPVDIRDFSDLLKFVGISREELGDCEFREEDHEYNLRLKENMEERAAPQIVDNDAMKVLLMDLSQFFSLESVLYNVVEPPLGLMYLMTYLKQLYGPGVKGKIVKSRIDFDNFAELKNLLEEFKPDVIGIRTLTYFKDFFHRTVARIRHWGIDVPIIAGGPYATSSYKECLQDPNIDMVVLGEGEVTFSKLIKAMMENNRQLPGEDVLKEILGLAYVPEKDKKTRALKSQIIRMEELADELSQQPGENLEPINHTSDLAYIIFTSGSTGNPKGALVEHMGMMNHIHAKINDLQVTGNSIVAQNAPHTFDISVWQFFIALTRGGRTAIYPEEIVFDPPQLISRITNQQVTILEVVPSYLSILLDILDSNHQHFKSLRYLLVTGETVKPWVVRRWFEKYPGIKMVNAYGPTEASDDITHFIMDRAYEDISIPIGKPIQNMDIYVVDKYMNLCPVGVKGEICVSGPGVGRGYLNQPRLTAGKFRPLCYRSNRSHRSYKSYRSYLYKTGDLGRWLPDGTIEFFGRIDHQVKIRGFRIELGEIENQLVNYPNINEAAVIVKENPRGVDGEAHVDLDQYLCAFVISSTRETLDVEMIKGYLSGQLPYYMVPDTFVQLQEMPITPNGKIDRKALAKMDFSAAREQEYVPPENEVEEQLVEIWANLLGTKKEKMSTNANFFELGGNSLNATIMMSKLHKTFSVDISLMEIFSTPTIREIGSLINVILWADNKKENINEKREELVI